MNKRHKHYNITLHQIVEKTWFEKLKCTYVLAGLEVCPSTKKKHWQIYVYYKHSRTFTSVQRGFRPYKPHIEICAGTAQENMEYCSKDGEWVEYGSPPLKRGTRTDIKKIKDDLKAGRSLTEIADEYPGQFLQFHKGFDKMRFSFFKEKAQEYRKVEVCVCFGPTRTGKSKACRVPGSFIIHDLQWWDGYDFEDIIVIDEYDSSVPIKKLLAILDGQPLRLPVKGAHTWAMYTKVYITSNVPPDMWHRQAKEVHLAALKARFTKVYDFGHDPVKDVTQNYTEEVGLVLPRLPCNFGL